MIRRRDFLAAAGASGVLAAVSANSATAEPRSADSPDSLDSPDSPDSPDSLDSRPGAPLDADFDFSWIDKLTGKHKAVFDALEVAEGAAFFRANMFRNQYKQVYKTELSDTNAVVVVRHHSFAMAMNDAYWQKYEVAKEFKINDDDGNPLKKNPADGTGGNSIQTLVASGVIVLGCNVAFGGVVGSLRKKENITREEADKLARTYLIPGVILQPSGVFAVLRAQEAGCNYIVAS